MGTTKHRIWIPKGIFNKEHGMYGCTLVEPKNKDHCIEAVLVVKEPEVTVTPSSIEKAIQKITENHPYNKTSVGVFGNELLVELFGEDLNGI